MSEPLNYLNLRERIQDGDIVFVARSKGIAGKITELVTRSPFYHVGIAFWMRDSSYESRLFIVEAHQGGRRIISLSSYAAHPLTVVKSEVPFLSYSSDLIAQTGSVPYGYMDFLAIGLWEVLKIKARDFSGEVCSEMVALSLNMGGLYLPRHISPGALFTRLVSQMDWKIRLTTDADSKENT